MTDKKIKKYCEGIDCAWCNQEEPCIYKIANNLEEKIKEKEEECKDLKELNTRLDNQRESYWTEYKNLEQEYERLKEASVTLFVETFEIIKENADLQQQINQLRTKIKEITNE